MLSDAQRGDVTKQLVTIRIIVGALCAGGLFLAGVVLLMPRRVADEPMLAFMALLFSVCGVIAAAIVPRMIGKRARNSLVDNARPQPQPSPSLASGDASHVSRIMGIYQTRLITSLALLEAAAFFNLVAYMIEGQVVNVAVALVLLVLMLIQFPSRTRTEHWVADQLQATRRGD